MKKDILINGIIVGSHESTGDPMKDIEEIEKFLKKKGLHHEPSENDAMYAQATYFTTVANNIYDKDLRKSPYNGSSVAPFIVNAVFSIELYLKTIHNFYNNNIKGHHLTKLFENMPTSGKNIFISSANDCRPLYKLEPNTDIHSCLNELNKAFEQWRYLYEHEQLSAEVQAIRYTLHTSHEACCRVRESKNET